jgi:hypothetical protein
MSNEVVTIRADVIKAAIGHLYDYIYHKTGCQMNYARSSADIVMKMLYNALEEKK